MKKEVWRKEQFPVSNVLKKKKKMAMGRLSNKIDTAEELIDNLEDKVEESFLEQCKMVNRNYEKN